MVCDPPEMLRIIGKDHLILTKHVHGAIGTCDNDELVITLDPKAPWALQRDTLLHEVIHAVDHAVVAKLTEEQVSALASGLYAVFSDNPNFLEWLNERPAKRSKQRNPRTT